LEPEISYPYSAQGWIGVIRCFFKLGLERRSLEL